MQKLMGQVAWFVLVGCAAAATHWLVVVAAVSLLGLAPLLANVAGWLVAFCVSFAGHYTLTFRHQGAPLGQALRRFFAVSAAGFGINEVAYALLLHATPIRYDVLLALILIAIAVLTFVAGRFWAFRQAGAQKV
ncbi:GtrA family protein [Pusillimonas minor]|uniref:GtrA family protein n=1 Tax=Pusillimonas minor TaxID=2697024 RepID=A0A842HN41_9BURK|nr:GtrA family protein [Pusillimonas minor]MBC2769656.1 GtrA family protein [Pusillimonas minor]